MTASPPNALLPTEEVTPEMIEAGHWAYAMHSSPEERVLAIYTAMRALAKPDELPNKVGE